MFHLGRVLGMTAGVPSVPRCETTRSPGAICVDASESASGSEINRMSDSSISPSVVRSEIRSSGTPLSV